jgi:hypothetical protein
MVFLTDEQPMTIKLTTGDLLEQRVGAIVNTVKTVGVMGKASRLSSSASGPPTDGTRVSARS